KNMFYERLVTPLQKINKNDKNVDHVDFNARVVTNFSVWTGILGRYGLKNANCNGIKLLNLCAKFRLGITNTIFQQRS
ncbi:hypothetical protein HELRODRAFT_83039, partial [Helobdella robusta]|uniref:Uncharacterized protein n=1 Tax=Helobdella robusta TaxID=6412 RepID=T1G4Z5_HELRO